MQASMRRMSLVSSVAVALAVVLGGTASAQSAGSWKLNLAKSQYIQGQAPKSSTLVYETEADGFLRKMVRSMVGGLIACGRHARTVDDLALALRARDRAQWPAPAPPCGLFLVRVGYPPGV